MEFEVLAFYTVLAVLSAVSLPIPFMLWSGRTADMPPLVPRGCFTSDDEYAAYMVKRCG